MGITPGLDLDGQVSDGSDAASCHMLDFVSADGTPGIDNQFATILPVVEAIPSVDLAADFRDAIASGEILLLIEVETRSGGEVALSFFTGRVPGGGAPLLDGDDLLAANQIFDLTPLSLGTTGDRVASTSFACAVLATVLAGAVDLPLPWPASDAPTPTPEPATIRGASLRFDASADGLTHGLIAGRLGLQDLARAITGMPSGSFIDDPTSSGVGDLDPDAFGVCQSISVALIFDAIPAIAGAPARERGR
ncbi:MAG: hypothetical protein GXP55_18420 [Deltaproteobacteria bacterium]|nr:hypothetical protein [Deltaproteobacteria bacterium]